MKRTPIFVVVAFVMIIGFMFGYPCPETYAQESACGPEVAQDGNTWTISATGLDDTVNIQCALDEAAASGSSATVQLEAGDFFIGTSIEVANFNGTFKGAGIGLTKIATIEDAIFPASIVFGVTEDWSWAFLFEYNSSEQMHLTISDLTFHAQSVTEPFLHQGTVVNWLGNAFFVQDNQDIGGDFMSLVDVDFERVEVYGNTNDPRFDNLFPSDDRSLFGAIEVYALEGDGLSGTINIRDNNLHDQAIAVLVFGVTDSRVTIGGSPQDGNLFENVIFTGTQVGAYNSDFVISHNQTVDSALIGMFGGGVASSFIVSHNDVDTFMGWEAIGFYWFFDGSTALIANNEIAVTSESSYAWSVIYTGDYSENIRIVNNTISGSCSAPGVVLSLSQNIDMRTNDFTAFSGNGYPDVWLSLYGDPDHNSTNCSVIGSSPPSTTVWDETPGENFLVNVNGESGRLDPP
jgi:hypothetical protein